MGHSRPQFMAPPSALNVEVVNGSYRSYCGIVNDGNGNLVLIAITRHKAAAPDVPYDTPDLEFVQELVGRSEVQRMRNDWRLPTDDDELRRLTAGLRS